MKIAILCANYNNSKYLVEFFDSLLQSRVVPDEVIFVDDGSTDDSLGIAKSYERALNLTIIALPKNVGFANALNVGLQRCTAELIARIDPDDYLHPDRLLLQSTEFKLNPELDVVGSQAQYFLSEFGKNLNQTNMPISLHEISRAFRRGDNGVLHGTTMIRRSTFKKYSYVQEEVPSEDYGIFLRMMADGAVFSNLNKPLTFVRIHRASVSNAIKLSTVKKIYEIRQKVLGISYIRVNIYREFLALRYYRKYMFEEKKIRRYYYLAIASAFGVDRVVRRIASVLFFSKE